MQFQPGMRRVALSIREFAEFRLGPGGPGEGGGSSPWRTQLGTTWHQKLRDTTAAADPTAQFEVPVKGMWIEGRWTLELQGRADQLVSRAGTLVVREIKTVSAPLPLPPEELAHLYPSYFTQLAAYVLLLGLEPERRDTPLTGELVFIDIASGLSQVVPLDTPEAFFRDQLHVLLPFFEERWCSRQRLLALQYKPPFQTLRSGQKAALDFLRQASGRSKLLALEAPTGFGKTGLLLDFALGRMREGVFTRLIYLTSKSTGQLQVLRQLESMVVGDEPLRYYQMRNRREHAIASPLHTCDNSGSCWQDMDERWGHAAISPERLFRHGTIPLETVRALGEQTGVCPYEISRAILPYAEVWLCDYNYVFAPSSQRLLADVPDFSPQQTLLIVDEAHNLPARVADAFSCAAAFDTAAPALDDLRASGAPLRVLQLWEHYCDFLEALRPTNRLDVAAEYELIDLLERLEEALAGAPLDYRTLPGPAVEQLWGIPAMRRFFENTALTRLPWCKAPGKLTLACLDAAPEIAATLRTYGGAVLASATLTPQDLYSEACGLTPTEIAWIDAHADWRTDAYDVAIDARVDTRLRQRERHYADTAQTVAAAAQTAPGPIAIFFPSYQYAEAIRAYVEATHPLLRLALQPRGVDLPGQQAFIEENLLTAHALFLVLGSGFSEGIDALGGQVTRALVIGPALPEISPEQEARLATWEHLGKAEAFRRTYIAPGMRKINQALGRLVRGPGQRAAVLLHCKRFADRAYLDLLAPEYRNARILKTDTDLAEWLSNLRGL